LFKCKCGREFNKKGGLSYHKNFCGKKKISLDGGYEYYIGPDGLRVYVHHEVMEQKLGRKLKEGEIVHHKDENKRNNAPSNLQLTNNSSHSKHHYELKSLEWKNKFKYNNPTGKGRKLKGTELPQSKLTEDQVREIKQCLNDGAKQSSLARRYKVDRTTIRDIKNGSNWKHVN